MKTTQRRLLGALLWLLLWPCLSVQGQIYKYLGLEDGLSSRNVYAVQQSDGGFMWFLTDNGIDRYDGTEISRYTIAIDGVKFTEYSSCHFLHDATRDNLWIATSGGKLLRYAQQSNSFEVMYVPEIQYRRSDIMSSAVSPIDARGDVWIFVGEQVFRYYVHTFEGHEMALHGSEGDVTYTSVISVGPSQLYIGTKGGVYKGKANGKTIEDTISMANNIIENENTIINDNMYSNIPKANICLSFEEIPSTWGESWNEDKLTIYYPSMWEYDENNHPVLI